MMNVSEPCFSVFIVDFKMTFLLHIMWTSLKDEGKRHRCCVMYLLSEQTFFTCSKLTVETIEKGVKYVNNKDTKTRSPRIVVTFVNLTNFTCRFSACIVDFKHVLRIEYLP